MTWLKRMYRWWYGVPVFKPPSDDCLVWHEVSEGPR
jgi:hypothetical protein